MTWHSKKLETFQLYLYLFFSELFFFWEKINSWLWRKKAIGLIYYLACVVVDIWSFLCEYDTILRWGEKFSTENNWSLRNLLHLPGMEWAEGCNISLGVCRKGKNVKQTRIKSRQISWFLKYIINEVFFAEKWIFFL